MELKEHFLNACKKNREIISDELYDPEKYEIDLYLPYCCGRK